METESRILLILDYLSEKTDSLEQVLHILIA